MFGITIKNGEIYDTYYFLSKFIVFLQPCFIVLYKFLFLNKIIIFLLTKLLNFVNSSIQSYIISDRNDIDSLSLVDLLLHFSRLSYYWDETYLDIEKTKKMKNELQKYNFVINEALHWKSSLLSELDISNTTTTIYLCSPRRSNKPDDLYVICKGTSIEFKDLYINLDISPTVPYFILESYEIIKKLKDKTITLDDTEYTLKQILTNLLNEVDIPYTHRGWYNNMNESITNTQLIDTEKNTVIKHIVNKIKSHKNIFLTGHSLGGVNATLIMFALIIDLLYNYYFKKNTTLPENITLYTFGCPKMGNTKFNQNFNLFVRLLKELKININIKFFINDLDIAIRYPLRSNLIFYNYTANKEYTYILSDTGIEKYSEKKGLKPFTLFDILTFKFIKNHGPSLYYKRIKNCNVDDELINLEVVKPYELPSDEGKETFIKNTFLNFKP